MVILKMVKETPITKTEAFGISGFTLGIMSIILAGWLGIFSSITGFVLCMVQKKKNPIKVAKVGIILNIVGFVISLVLIGIYFKALIPALQQLG